MKKENGITLISLVITIILILILATVATYTGFETYENMRVQAFVTKMKAIQEAVDKLCEEHTIQEINGMGEAYNSASIPSEDNEVLTSFIEAADENEDIDSWYPAAGDGTASSYRYFSIENISSILGIKDFDTAIFFNPRTRNVIAVDGVKYEDVMYYRQYDLPTGQELTSPNTYTDLNLSASVKTFDDKAVIYINTDKNIEQLKYSKKISEGNYENAIISKNLNEITITESGTYRVEATLNSSSSSVTNGIVTEQVDVEVAIVNKPLLVAGMTPIKYNGSGEVETTVNDEDWYNYGENRWANAKLKDGSVYVWIPRYAYSITYNNNENVSAGGVMNIEFMKGNSSAITTSGKSLKNNYKVMPAFRDGTENGFANGEWDSEITGIWVAKYETSKQTVNSKDYPKNSYLENTEIWKNISPKDMFNVCRAMEEISTTYFDSSIRIPNNYNYGTYRSDTNNIDTHLMKNSEYGAIAYLTYSKYGNEDIEPAEFNTYVDNTIESSTTGNKYGIFGISGGAAEVVAAGRNISTTDGPSFNSENKSTKYATYYDTEGNNKIIGDGVKETKNWARGGTTPESVYCTNLFSRGGDAANGGLFVYQEKSVAADNQISFRPVLIVEYDLKNTSRGNAIEIAKDSSNIGAKVNYTAGNTSIYSGDWEILYADNSNVYIITTGNLAASDLTTPATGTTYGGTDDFKSLDIEKYPAVADGWLYKIYSNGNLLYNSGMPNMKATEYILDSTNAKWSGLKNSFAKWVIGGPTLELLVASYNEVNPRNIKTIEDLEANGKGYKNTIDSGSLPNTNTSGVAYNPWNHGITYWLACPSSINENHVRVMYHVYGYVSREEYSNSFAFRPVVCLKSNTVLTWNNTTNMYDLSTR